MVLKASTSDDGVVSNWEEEEKRLPAPAWAATGPWWELNNDSNIRVEKS